MTSIEHDTDARLADFMAAWRRITTDDADDTAGLIRGGYALIGLTNFGQRPVPSTRPGRGAGLAGEQGRGAGTPGGLRNPGRERAHHRQSQRAPSAPRRHVQIGDRWFGVTGCAPDVFLYAPLVRPSLQVEETCPATGRLVRLVFTPSGVESADPAGVVVAMPHPQELDQPESGFDLEECRSDLDGNLCSPCPFSSSAEAAQG